MKWKEYALADLTELVIDYRGKTPKKLGADWSNEGYRALSAKNIKTGMIVQPDTIRYCDEDLYQKWMKDEVARGDILITSEAPFGQVYYWDSDEKIVLSQRLFDVRVKPSFDSKYVYFYMTSSMFQGELDARATGTTVVGLRQPELMKCKVLCPDYDTQKKISSLLYSIEQKINKNNMINDNLEQQVQSLYAYQFGNLPQNATVADVSSNITDGVHNTVKDTANGEFLLLSCKNIKGGVISLGSNERHINEETFNKLRKRTKLAKGDILLSSVGTIGELLLVTEEPNNYEFQRSVAMIKPNLNFVSSYYLYEALLNQKTEIIHAAHGAVQQCLFLGDISKFPIAIPEKEQLLQFDDIVRPMFNIITTNHNENQRLSVLRDSLIPKLMSGELDVSAIDL